jgi:hypothetical protein
MLRFDERAAQGDQHIDDHADGKQINGRPACAA